MSIDSRTLALVMRERTTEGMSRVAAAAGFLVDGRVDLRDAVVRFRHDDLDLSRFLFERTQFAERSLLRNCSAVGAGFRDCRFASVRFESKGAAKRSFRGADFSGASLDDCYLGPATLDLAEVSFAGARLHNVTFMLGRLAGACFDGATLTDVELRSADLRNASFRGATLTRTSLERARLAGADFTGAHFVEMVLWGEPDYTGATIGDELRFRYGEVKSPCQRLDALLDRELVDASDREAVRTLRQRLHLMAPYPEGLVDYDEVGEGIDFDAFVRIMKRLKDDALFDA